MTTVLVLGANGRLGREVVQSLAARTIRVIAFVRREFADALPGVSVVRGDATRAEDLLAANEFGVDVVVDAIGAGTLKRNVLESTVAQALVDVMESRGPKRLIAMSAGMVGQTFFVMDRILKATVFRHILAEHRRVEEIVAASTLEWTIVRPPRITGARPRGYDTSAAWQHGWSIAAADVGAFIAAEIVERRFVRQCVFLAPKS